MPNQQKLSEILFAGHGLKTGFCSDPNCADAVVQFEETGRWYITFGHAGYNSPANNHLGYRSEEIAIKWMRYYLNK